MTLQERIHKWLGIEEALNRLHNIQQVQISINRNLRSVNEKLDIIAPGLGRVIANLDAKYTESEFSAARKAESDKLGEEVLRRLEAEAAARAPYNE